MTEACAPAIRYRLAQLNPCRLRERDTREPRGPGLRVCVSRGLRGGYRLLHVAMMSKVRTNLLHEPWLRSSRTICWRRASGAVSHLSPPRSLLSRAARLIHRQRSALCRRVRGMYETNSACDLVRTCEACTGQALPSHLRPYAQAMPCLRALSCTRGVRGPRSASSHICACALSMRWLSRPSACTSGCACTCSHCLPAVFVIDSDALTLSCVRMHVLHVLHVPHVPHVLHVLHALRVQG